MLPYGAGSATDIITRIMCEQLRQIIGQSCVVENKPGAFGILAIEDMARARPDGYTLQVGNVSTNAITPVLFKDKFNINYERDVVAVSRLADLPTFLMATTKNLPPKTLAEFVAYAKERPGKLKYASPGAGSFPHYDMEILSRRAGISMQAIHIKAGPPGFINDMALGDIQVAYMNVATSAPQIRAGTLRPLVTTTEARLADYPDVPTMAEAGYPGVGTTLWAGLFAPAATPAPVLETLHKAVVQALNSPQVKDAFTKAEHPRRPERFARRGEDVAQRRDRELAGHHEGNQDRSDGLEHSRHGRACAGIDALVTRKAWIAAQAELTDARCK